MHIISPVVLISQTDCQVFLRAFGDAPLAKPVLRNTSTQDIAVNSPIKRSPRTITFALLCSRHNLAEVSSCTNAALTHSYRLTAIDIPIPDPQIKIPIPSFERIERANLAA